MPKPSKDDLQYGAPLDEMVRGARRAAAFKAALELDIFSRIAEGNRSLPALLHASGMNERGTRLLLDALANLGLLLKSAFEYSLSPVADTFLVKGKPTYCGEALLSQLAWEVRGQLARSVRSGRPALGGNAEPGTRLLLTHGGSSWSHWQTIVQDFGEIWQKLELGAFPNSGLRALGFGAEAGLRLLSLAENDRSVRLSIVDVPSALTLLEPIVATLPSHSQIELLGGDWISVSLPHGAYGLVLVDSITAYGNFERNIGILHRALEALVMGGRIVLRALVVDDDRNGPGSVPLAGLDLLLASVNGDIYTITEYRGMLEAAGFFEVKQIDDQDGILTARRVAPPPPPPPADTIAPDFIPPPETLP
jgi:Dimerisation domain/O-methyltransferase domain